MGEWIKRVIIDTETALYKKLFKVLKFENIMQALACDL